MNIGDRFKKDGKLIEVTSVNDWGYGFKEVVEEEALPEDTVFDFPAEVADEGNSNTDSKNMVGKVTAPLDMDSEKAVKTGTSTDKTPARKVVRRKRKV